MRRADRLFEIIQLLRRARDPVTADALAATLEVSSRTVYRDIAALQATRTPIEGAAGVGYILRPSYDLPPVNFDPEEAEAVIVGLSLLARTGDLSLQKAAKRVAAKLDGLEQGGGRRWLSQSGAKIAGEVDAAALRRAIRDEVKVSISYRDGTGLASERIIRPLGLIYYVESLVLAAWCELRTDFRHFRLDRMQAMAVLEADFKGEGETLRAQWESLAALSEDHVKPIAF